MTIREVAQSVGASEQTVRRHLKQGRFPNAKEVQIPGQGQYMFDIPKADFEAYVLALREGPRQPSKSIELVKTMHERDLLRVEVNGLRDRLADREQQIADLRAQVDMAIELSQLRQEVHGRQLAAFSTGAATLYDEVAESTGAKPIEVKRDIRELQQQLAIDDAQQSPCMISKYIEIAKMYLSTYLPKREIASRLDVQMGDVAAAMKSLQVLTSAANDLRSNGERIVRKPANMFSDEDRAEILADQLRTTDTYKAVAERYEGVSEYQVRDWRDNHSIFRKAQNINRRLLRSKSGGGA